MKHNIIIVAGLAMIAGLLAYGYATGSKTDAGPSIQGQPQTAAVLPAAEQPETDDAQTSDEGQVEVAVTPVGDFASEAETWDFTISLNTHSVELAEDLAQVSVLIDEQGTEYLPTAWDGDPPGGHHREGVLSFEPFASSSAVIRLEMRGVGGVAVRRFSWNR